MGPYTTETWELFWDGSGRADRLIKRVIYDPDGLEDDGKT